MQAGYSYNLTKQERHKMKKGQEYNGTVVGHKFPNKGIVAAGQDGEERCIVKNTVPGQKIRFRVSKKRGGQCEGNLLEVTERSPDETESFCRHFDVCGGCSYQTLPYDLQLKLKEKQVHELLEPVIGAGADKDRPTIGEVDINQIFEPIAPAPSQFEYRNKMEFSFGDASFGGDLELGLHKRGSFYDIVTCTDCRIVDDDYRTILKETLAYFRGKDTPYFHKRTHEGFLRYLLVRKGKRTGEILIDLVTTSQTPADTICTEVSLLDDWKEMLLSLKLSGKITGILHTVDDRVADIVADDGTEVLYGMDYFNEQILGLSFKITPFSFFQTNTLSAEVLYSKVREYAKYAIDSSNGAVDAGDSNETGRVETGSADAGCIEAGGTETNGVEASGTETGDIESGSVEVDGFEAAGSRKKGMTIYDLYSGTGTIGQIMSTEADKVIGIEIVEEAVKAANENAARNGLHNCTFLAGDVLKILDEVEEKPDMIILDPPRDGINPKALTKIADYGVGYIIYVSCKPTSLARDMAYLMSRGYRPVKICPIDQFPGTVHVETVVLLTRQNT